jgi:hypothetical protein
MLEIPLVVVAIGLTALTAAGSIRHFMRCRKLTLGQGARDDEQVLNEMAIW